jgi:hypothetical protein
MTSSMTPTWSKQLGDGGELMKQKVNDIFHAGGG